MSTPDTSTPDAQAQADTGNAQAAVEAKASSAVAQGEDNLADDAADAPDGESTETPAVDDKPKKKSGIQRLKERHAREMAEIRREIQSLRTPDPSGQRQSESNDKDVSAKPAAEQFNSAEEYYEALADWKVEQKFKTIEAKRNEEALRAESQRQAQTFQERVQTFSVKHTDFQDAIEDVDDVPMSLAVQQHILNADNGPELMYQLAKNRSEYERICKLPAAQAYYALGKFEASLAKENTKPIEIKKTQAPEPIKPLASKGAPTKKSLSDDDISFAEYERLRRDQMRKRG